MLMKARKTDSRQTQVRGRMERLKGQAQTYVLREYRKKPVARVQQQGQQPAPIKTLVHSGCYLKTNKPTKNPQNG